MSTQTASRKQNRKESQCKIPYRNSNVIRSSVYFNVSGFFSAIHASIY